MANEPEVTPGEAPDDSAPADVVASETASGEAPNAASQQAEAEREAFLNEVARRVAQQMMANQPQPSPPPTPAAGGGLDPLEREAQAIVADLKALDDRVQREGGYTADTLLKRMELTDRTSALRAEATLQGLKRVEEERQVTKFGSEDRWQEFYQRNRSRGDVELLRAAFERDELKAAAEAEKNKPKPPTIKPTNDRPVVDVSAPSEVTASERKARTMTHDQVREHKRKLEAEGRYSEVRDFDRSIRNGDVILK